MCGGKKDPELLEIPGAEGVAVDFFNKLLNMDAPKMDIPLQGVASMSEAEQTTQGILSKFLSSDPTKGEAYQLGMGELKKTLGGDFYDPVKSDFWKGFRDVSKMEQEQGVADIRRRGQLGGGLYATPNQRIESEYIGKEGSKRQAMLGGLFERERNRKSDAVGKALGYAGFGEQGIRSRLEAGTNVGAVPRSIENQKLQAKYNQLFEQEKADKASALFPYQFQAPIAQQLMPQWNIDQGGGESPLGGILGLIGTILTAGK